MASEFLCKNKSNRKINNKQLDMIIRTILDGKWRLTHQGVAFYEDGELADGQHRLYAIVKTGVTLPMPVFQGIKKDLDTVMAIDCGKGRTVVDSAAISGLKVKPSDISIAKGLEFGYSDRSFQRMTHSESYNLCAKHSDTLVVISNLFPRNKPFVTLTPVKVAAADAIKNGVPFDVAKAFCAALITGEYSESIYVNAVRLSSKMISKNYNAGSSRQAAYNMMFNTLTKTSKGIEVKRIVESKLI